MTTIERITDLLVEQLGIEASGITPEPARTVAQTVELVDRLILAAR